MPTPRSYPNWPAGWPFSSRTPPVRAPSAMVATTDVLATEAGLDVLRAGGNAVDAAVAVGFALAVVNPEAGNVGGGGFLLVRTAEGEEAALDFRSRAPARASRDMYVGADPEGPGGPRLGHLAAAVPGSVQGMWDVHRRFGSLPWARLLDPAIRLAEGFVVTERFLHSYTPDVVEGLAKFESSARIFLGGGGPPALGERFEQADLAATLERIQADGAEGFYAGRTADLLVADMERHGGLLSHEDLRSYRTLWRDPIRFAWGEHTVVSMPPSSSGGVTLVETAHIMHAMEAASGEPAAWHDADDVHLLAEAWRRAFADRNAYLADTDFVDVPLEVLCSAEYGAWRARDFDPARATPSAEVRPGVEAWRAGAAPADAGAVAAVPRREPDHTTHYSIVDADGNAASVTTTINTWYGSKAVAGGTGVLLNNDMDDLSAIPGQANYFGLVQGERNAIEPGKRPLSAMTPVIVLDGSDDLAMVVGSPGGGTIITTLFQVLANVLDHGMDVSQAVLAPRVHHQHLPDTLSWEPGGLPDEVLGELEERGHTLEERVEFSGDVQAIMVEAGGGLAGQSDPRRGGATRGS